MRIDKLIKRYHEASGVSLKKALADYDVLCVAWRARPRRKGR